MLDLLAVAVLAVLNGSASRPVYLASDAVQHRAPADEPIADEEVARIYEELQTKAVRERAQILVQLSPVMQSAVWTRHFVTSLVRHPELTTEQRAVIQEALTILTPELFALERSDPRWKELVDAPLRRLQEKALVAFPDRKFARELFTDLGPEPKAENVAPSKRDSSDAGTGTPRLARPRIVAPDYDDCACSTESDWCEWSMIGTIADVACRAEWCKFKSAGCGTLRKYSCNGLCLIRTA